MRLVKQRPKYRCDFCRHTSTKEAMEVHERRCWKNPNRYCDACENTGRVVIDEGMGLTGYVDCWACTQFDPDKAGLMSEKTA